MARGRRVAREAKGRDAFSLRDAASLALVVGAIWLGWQILREPLAERAPPVLAVRVAPTSANVLARAAEAELAAGQRDNAERLAAAALSRTPLNVRALRVFGMARADAGAEAQANEVMTLAGNLSLRDDITHGWLVERRLRQGDYVSAFAHADTLARRQSGLWPQTFSLFAETVAYDPAALTAVVRLLVARPPWRSSYLRWLQRDRKDDSQLATLIVALEATSAPLSDAELAEAEVHWLATGRVPALRAVRERIGRPAITQFMSDGDFPADPAPPPFGWTLEPGPGVTLEVVRDDLRPGETALRTEYDGRTAARMARQLMMLPVGTFRFSGEARVEVGASTQPVVAWRVRCLETGNVIIEQRLGGESAGSTAAWTAFSAPFTVPAQGCSAQWLDLEGVPTLRGVRGAIWFDRLNIRRGGQ